MTWCLRQWRITASELLLEGAEGSLGFFYGSDVIGSWRPIRLLRVKMSRKDSSQRRLSYVFLVLWITFNSGLIAVPLTSHTKTLSRGPLQVADLPCTSAVSQEFKRGPYILRRVFVYLFPRCMVLVTSLFSVFLPLFINSFSDAKYRLTFFLCLLRFIQV